MIEETNVAEVIKKNLMRTESLIEAMEKIRAYNRIYQMNASAVNPKFAEAVTQVQNEQLARIEESCGEHAIISLATAFETYYKELLQQLLFDHPEFFLSQQTKYSDLVQQLIEESNLNSYDQIEVRLKLKDRFHYYQFFAEYSISLLNDQEAEFIEYIYARRNSLVHNAGKATQRTQRKLQKVAVPVDNAYVSTESKRLRTKFKKIIKAIDQRIRRAIS
jgi:hypothetical protein